MQPDHIFALPVPDDALSFFNISNRMAFALDMMPNPEYHRLDR